MEGLDINEFVFEMLVVVTLVSIEKLIKTLNEKGILEQNYK
tara:strand:+ start:281 stop:403 length:123 start_codon:yes stop_codon:yes gene_type:complete